MFSGIIGGGLGGTSSAFYMSQLFPSSIIDVYEYDRVGGRLRTEKFAGNYYETGGTIIHPDNFYMANFTQTLGKYFYT